MLPLESISRIPWTAESAVIPPPTIRYLNFGMDQPAPRRVNVQPAFRGWATCRPVPKRGHVRAVQDAAGFKQESTEETEFSDFVSTLTPFPPVQSVPLRCAPFRVLVASPF